MKIFSHLHAKWWFLDFWKRRLEKGIIVLINFYGCETRFLDFDNLGKNVTRKLFQPMFNGGFCVPEGAGF